MSKYCTGNIYIGADRCSVIEADTYSSDELVGRTNFLSNVRPGDAFLLYRRSSYEWSEEWSLYTVTSVKSDSIFTFTPKFQTGVAQDDDPTYDDYNYVIDYMYAGQRNDPDDSSNISDDGRYCFNSKWYTSRDFTCFFDLPEIKKGDRAWAEIFNNALNRIDKLLLVSQRNEISGFSYCGGFIKIPKGNVLPRPDALIYFTALDFGGEVCSDAFKIFAQSISVSSSIFMSASGMGNIGREFSGTSLKTIKKFDSMSTAIKFYSQITDSYLAGLTFNAFVIQDNNVGYIDLHENDAVEGGLGRDIFLEFKIDLVDTDQAFLSSEFISSKLENTLSPGTFTDIKMISSKQSISRVLKTMLSGIEGLSVTEMEIYKFNNTACEIMRCSINEATYPETAILNDSFVFAFIVDGIETYIVSILDTDCKC